jgi:SecD/SecF fusion protein
MQAKGLIKIFLVLIAITCIFPIAYTVVSQSYENKADKFAKAKSGLTDSNKSDSLQGLSARYKRAYLDSMGSKEVFLGISLQKCMERQLSLGLDL